MLIEFEFVCQVLILEPSKVFQPSIVSVSEEDESRTVQLKHVTPLKVGASPYDFLFVHMSEYNIGYAVLLLLLKLFSWLMLGWMLTLVQCMSFVPIEQIHEGKYYFSHATYSTQIYFSSIYAFMQMKTAWRHKCSFHLCLHADTHCMKACVSAASLFFSPHIFPFYNWFCRKAYTSGLSQQVKSEEWGKMCCCQGTHKMRVVWGNFGSPSHFCSINMVSGLTSFLFICWFPLWLLIGVTVLSSVILCANLGHFELIKQRAARLVMILLGFRVMWSDFNWSWTWQYPPFSLCLAWNNKILTLPIVPNRD